MKTKQTISVVIPVFNGEKYLAETIGSILAQSRAPDEVMVVDDGSTDASADVARRFAPRVQLLALPHRGAAGARNAGVAKTGGDLLAFCDADDLWASDKLERQEEVLLREAEIDAVFGMARHFISPDLTAAEAARFVLPEGVQEGIALSAILIRRSSFLHFGTLDEQLKIADFIKWHTRAINDGLKQVVLPAEVFRRRIHLGNLSHNNARHYGEYVRIARENLNQRRDMDRKEKQA